MGEETDVTWSGRPWIGPAVAIRTIALIVGGFLIYAILSTLGGLALTLLAVPLYAWLLGLLAIAWFASVVGLLVMRASFRYVLRQSSIEVEQGIVRKRNLVVSPSAFSELEVDQGIIGRILNYGNLEVRSQGGQQLNLMLIRDPKGVSTKIRGVMTIPMVRIAKDEPALVTPARQ
jgi:uncharacterized membrane protein YdbT with pleckstrin-like domain